jgi:hypothetical protein
VVAPGFSLIFANLRAKSHFSGCSHMRKEWVPMPLWAFDMTRARWWVPLRFSVMARRLLSSQCSRAPQRTNGTWHRPDPGKEVDDVDEAISIGNDADARASS